MRRFVIMIIAAALGLVVAAPMAAQAAPGTYAALGDSVAAGAGVSGSGACDRSAASYPHLVAEQTGLSLAHYACTGAKADEGLYGSQRRGGDRLPAQLNQAFSGGTPSLITLTIGANDARWTQFMRQCYYLRCGYGVDTARFKAYLLDLKFELDTTMRKIAELSDGTPPQVIITGYYDPFSGETCDDTAGLSPREMSWLGRRADDLNDAIRETADEHSFASYASVSFTGHELCSANSWVQGQYDEMPFHPTAAGQQAIAEAVMDEYSAMRFTETGTQNYASTTPAHAETEKEAPQKERKSSLERLKEWCRRMRE